MKSKLPKLFLYIVLLPLPFFVYAASPTLSVFPTTVIQGEPAEITVQNVTLSQVKSLSFNGKKLGIFLYKDIPTALVGIDIHQKPDTYVVFATLDDGTILEKNLIVNERPTIKATFDIPASLGGNSTSSTQILVSSLATENATLVSLYTGTHAFWTRPFKFPLSQIAVTDSYGYSRQTNGSSITHKGTDFHAKTGTPVMAMNRGVVRLAKQFTEYGNTVVIDHGLGLMTFYMHLSKINVKVGQLVDQGQVIGLSGQTGYATAPHLHITIRLNDISIDPIKFMDLFK